MSDRRKLDRGEIDRRRSERWFTEKTFEYRLHRGKKIWAGEIIERSLDGLVIKTDAYGTIKPGKRITLNDKTLSTKLGFTSALIKRCELDKSDDRMLMVVEIEA